MTKKILIVNAGLGSGGISTYTINLAKGLLNRGNSVFLVITHFYENEKLIICQELGINIISLVERNKISKYFQYAWILRRINPDIVINNYNFVAQFVSFLNRKRKLIHIIHNDTQDFYRIALIAKKNTDLWITPTTQIKSNFLKFANSEIDPYKITVINHGIDEYSDFDEKKDSKVLKIIFVGVMYEHKGVALLCDIFVKLRGLNITFQANLIGTGPLKKKIEDRIYELNLESHVKFWGQLDYKIARTKINESDILLFPTRIESFGLVIAEAMISGVVPVVSLLPGITDDIIQDGKTGFLIKEYLRPDEFVEKIALLNNDKVLRRNISESARIWASKKFSLNVMIDEYEKAINQLRED